MGTLKLSQKFRRVIGYGQVKMKCIEFTGEKKLKITIENIFLILAAWFLPTQSKYGVWPRSGEIDLLESRGNLKYGNDTQIGVEQIVSTLHFGPNWDQDAYSTSSFSKNNADGHHNDFHKYELIWNESGIKFLIDDIEFGNVPVENGFWQRGKFKGENIWASASKMAPFDQEVI